MKISEYVAILEAIKAEHGDLEVDTWNVVCDRVSASRPSVAYRKILIGRESKPRFWDKYEGPEAERKGEKVVRV